MREAEPKKTWLLDPHVRVNGFRDEGFSIFIEMLVSVKA